MREVFIPVLGMAPDDVQLTAWLREPGELLAAGDPVAVVETSKTELELTAEAAGRLGTHLFAVGKSLAPGTVIAHVLAEGEQEPQPAASQPAAPEPVGARLAPAEASAPTAGTSSGPRHSISPRARRAAAEAAAAAPEAAATSQPGAAPPPAEARPATEPRSADAPTRAPAAREAIARSVARSWAEIPHFAVTRELPVGELLAAVRGWRAVVPALTLTDLLLRALALALVDRLGRSDVAVGLAVATDAGVVTPTVPAVPHLELPALVQARRGAVERARAGRLATADLRPPDTTLSNLGALGVDHFTGIVPHGTTSIITVGRAAERPAVIEGRLGVAATMWVTANLDHRALDGADGATLLARLAAILASPALFCTAAAPLPAPTTPPMPPETTR